MLRSRFSWSPSFSLLPASTRWMHRRSPFPTAQQSTSTAHTSLHRSPTSGKPGSCRTVTLGSSALSPLPTSAALAPRTSSTMPQRDQSVMRQPLLKRPRPSSPTAMAAEFNSSLKPPSVECRGEPPTTSSATPNDDVDLSVDVLSSFSTRHHHHRRLHAHLRRRLYRLRRHRHRPRRLHCRHPRSTSPTARASPSARPCSSPRSPTCSRQDSRPVSTLGSSAWLNSVRLMVHVL